MRTNRPETITEEIYHITHIGAQKMVSQPDEGPFVQVKQALDRLGRIC